MNLKILASPLLIFAIVVSAIWFVYPAYSDLLATRDKLNEVNLNLKNVDQKIQTAEKLNTEIFSDETHQNMLMSFLPAEKNEEEIVNELNDIIFNQGMIVSGLSFEAVENSLGEAPVQALDQSGIPIVDPVTGQPVYSETIPKIKSAKAKVSAIGDYDKIKGFLRKIINLKRMNIIASIKIFKEENVSSGAETENSSSGAIKMEATVDFKYLEKVKNTIDMDDGIFTSGQLNLSALDQVQEIRNTIIPELRIEANGKQNPFFL